MKQKKLIQFDHGHIQLPFWLRHSRRSMIFALAAAIFVGVFVLVRLLYVGHPLDWDESVYAVKVMSWVHGTPSESFSLYRPIGVPAIAWLFSFFAQPEVPSLGQVTSWSSYQQGLESSAILLRFFGGFFAAVAATLLFLLVSRMSSVLIGFATVAVSVTSFLFLSQAPLLSNDIAAAGLLLGTMLCIWRHYRSGGRDRFLYGAVLFAALAFYVRYGVGLYLSVIFFATVILFMMQAYGRDDDRVRTDGERFYFNHSLKSLVLFVALLLPHFLYSMLLFGRDPLGILRLAGRAAERSYFGEGLVDYALLLPEVLVSPVTRGLVALGLVGTFALFFVRRFDLFFVPHREYRALYWSASIALSCLLLVGLLVHGEPRYLFFPLLLLIMIGVWFVDRTLRQFHPFLASLALFLLIGWSASVLPTRIAQVNALHAVQDEYRSSFVSAAQIIAADVADRRDRCFVWTTEAPQISLYSGCHTLQYDPDILIEQLTIHRDDVLYLTVFDHTDKAQPVVEALRALGIVLHPVDTEASQKVFGSTAVYRMFYAGSGGTERLTK